MDSPNERISQQAHRAMKNLNLHEMDVFAAAKNVKPESKSTEDLSAADPKECGGGGDGLVVERKNGPTVLLDKEEGADHKNSSEGNAAHESDNDSDARESASTSLWQRKDDEDDEKDGSDHGEK